MLFPQMSNSTTGFLLQTMLYVANITKLDLNAPKTREDFLLSPMGADSDPESPRCYGIYGCFPINGPWGGDQRPIINYPETPMKINTRYGVYTKYNRHLPKYLSLNDSAETKFSGINPKGNIYLIAHGYLDSGDRPWVLELMNALLDKDRTGMASVITIDWSNGATPPYSQAVANIRLVGVITAHVLFMIYEQYKMKNLDNVHMIGHSLGSHLSGYTGSSLQKDFGLTLGRITALDPADPLFTDTESIVRLDSNDAKFVDVIHTDIAPFTMGGLGMPKPIGHVDFYPNGGHTNPGCDRAMQDYILETGSLSVGFQRFFSCNHVRSQEFFLESIKSNCTFTGVSCDSYESFLLGHCTCKGTDKGFCLRFGLEAATSYQRLIGTKQLASGQPIKAYLMTGPQKPFCRSHFKMTIIMSGSIESLGHGEEIGILTVEVQSSNEKTEPIRFSKEPMTFAPEKSYSAVIPGREVGIPEAVILNWEYRTSLNPLTWRIVAPRVYIQHIIVESLEHNARIIMCPIYPSEPVVSGTPSEFRNEYCNSYRNE